MQTLGEILRQHLDKQRKENIMLSTVLVIGFKTKDGSKVLFDDEHAREIAKAAHDNKIVATNEVRSRFDLSLAEAKDFIDAVCMIYPTVSKGPNWFELLDKYVRI